VRVWVNAPALPGAEARDLTQAPAPVPNAHAWGVGEPGAGADEPALVTQSYSRPTTAAHGAL
jgi:hypothetical protein